MLALTLSELKKVALTIELPLTLEEMLGLADELPEKLLKTDCDCMSLSETIKLTVGTVDSETNGENDTDGE